MTTRTVASVAANVLWSPSALNTTTFNNSVPNNKCFGPPGFGCLQVWSSIQWLHETTTTGSKPITPKVCPQGETGHMVLKTKQKNCLSWSMITDNPAADLSCNPLIILIIRPANRNQYTDCRTAWLQWQRLIKSFLDGRLGVKTQTISIEPLLSFSVAHFSMTDWLKSVISITCVFLLRVRPGNSTTAVWCSSSSTPSVLWEVKHSSLCTQPATGFSITQMGEKPGVAPPTATCLLFNEWLLLYFFSNERVNKGFFWSLFSLLQSVLMWAGLFPFTRFRNQSDWVENDTQRLLKNGRPAFSHMVAVQKCTHSFLLCILCLLCNCNSKLFRHVIRQLARFIIYMSEICSVDLLCFMHVDRTGLWWIIIIIIFIDFSPLQNYSNIPSLQSKWYLLRYYYFQTELQQ